MRSDSLSMLKPPLEQLPPRVKNIRRQLVARDTFYVVECRKLPSEELSELDPWLL